MNLTHFNPDILVGLYDNPIEFLRLVEKSVSDLQKKFIVDLNDPSIAFKANINTKFLNFPVTNCIQPDFIPNNNSRNKMVIFNCNVLRVSEKKVLYKQRGLKCAKCGHIFYIKSPEDQYNIYVKPKMCPNASCRSSTFKALNQSEFTCDSVDYQEIRIQEQIHKVGLRNVPKSITAVLEGGLVDCVKPGDQVEIIGIMLSRWKALGANKPCEIEFYIKISSVNKLHSKGPELQVALDEDMSYFKNFWLNFESNPYTGRDVLLKNVCSKLNGMYPVKLAFLLQMIGGNATIDENMLRTRGDIHILLVGDPGIGKSQILHYAQELFPQAVMTTGIGSTNAGFTAAATRDGGTWHLEAGALVMADGCICCIDEFNSIKETDKAAIHEAMEQQTVSVAKAGMVNKLNTRCSILAVTNPKGSYDINQPMNLNLAMSSPLLSRFDLIILLLDRKDDNWDEIIANHLLVKKETSDENPDTTNDGIKWTTESIRRYILCAKMFRPQFQENAKVLVSKYYSLQRSNDSTNGLRTTVRLLESLVRLSCAHSKLMFKMEIDEDDVVEAIFIMEYSYRGIGMFENRLKVCQIQPPDDGQAAFNIRKEKILKFLSSVE
ncbi:MAG: DNA helicase mcm9 [Paramarteilia canceri]